MYRLCAFFDLIRRSHSAYFWAMCGIIISLLWWAPARAEVRQLGIDIPVYWYADASDTMPLDAFLSLPEEGLKTAPLIRRSAIRQRPIGYALRSRRPYLLANSAGCSSVRRLSIV